MKQDIIMISTTDFEIVHYIRFSTTAHLALNINLPDPIVIDILILYYA